MTDIAHRSPHAMARCLVTYIKCDKRVMHEVLSHWGASPCLHTIRKLRESKARPMLDYAGFDERGWDWNGNQHRADMEMASNVFVAAIERERKAA